MECTEQNSSKQVDNNKKVKVLAYKNLKIAKTTTNAKLADKELLIASVKKTLENVMLNMNMKKLQIQNID